MTKKLTQKMTSLINRSSQREALLWFLFSGTSFTAAGARAAGIADPRRVVNYLRSLEIDIVAERIADRAGNVTTQYRLAPEKVVTKKSSSKKAPATKTAR
jgi:chemotaxis receptor (MCP) glutamine deamidase CheD